MEKEIHLFGIGIIAGIILGSLFDAGRAWRRKIPHKKWEISLEDFLFWMFTGIFLFSILEKYNKGVLRFYVFLGTGLGVLFYVILLHRPIFFLFSHIFSFVRKIYDVMKKIFGELRKIMKKLIFFPLKNVIKQITIMIRNN